MKMTELQDWTRDKQRYSPSPLHWFETPRTLWILRFCLPLIYWRFLLDRSAIYLSFDDGPVAGVTDGILNVLDSYQAKATFFCLGMNIEQEPKIFNRLVDSGHSIGNHSYSHLAGWKTSLREYLEDVEKCDHFLPKSPNARLSPFRPPFGELGVFQGLNLVLRRKIVMWDVNSMDYRQDQSPKMIADRVIQYVRPGSIVLLHDSEEAGPRTIEALPIILENVLSRGLKLKAI